MPDSLQPVGSLLAFWVAVALFRGSEGVRFALGLALGAAFAHLGWALLYWDRALAAPASLLDPTRGFCVLFVPLGVLAVAPRAAWRRPAFLAAGLRALPPALATARLGCLAAGCCRGDQPGFEWLPAACEIALLGALQLAVLQVDCARTPVLVLVGIGAIRLLLDPLRAEPPLGAPLVGASAIAIMLIALGLWEYGRPAHPASVRRPGNA